MVIRRYYHTYIHICVCISTKFTQAKALRKPEVHTSQSLAKTCAVQLCEYTKLVHANRGFVLNLTKVIVREESALTRRHGPPKGLTVQSWSHISNPVCARSKDSKV